MSSEQNKPGPCKVFSLSPYINGDNKGMSHNSNNLWTLRRETRTTWPWEIIEERPDWTSENEEESPNSQHGGKLFA